MGLLLALMATVAVHAAPQINEREVVGEVIQSLGPAIQQALVSLGSSSSSSSSSSFGSSPIVGRVSSTSSASRPQTSRRNTFVSAPTGVTRSASGPSVSSVTSSVVSQLQPSIAAAVAEALKASSRPVSRPQVSSYKAVEEPNYGPATTSSISNNRARVSSSSQVSQEALIAQILSSIQPKISSAVQGALSSSTQTAARRTVAVAAPRQQAVRVAAPRPIAPRPRPGVIAPSSRRVAQTSSSRGNLGDVFGNGETSVKFATPQFQFEF